MPDFKKLTSEIRQHANPSQAAALQRFFKTAPGEYGAGDVFWGLKVPQQRQIAKKYPDLSRGDIGRLLASKIHEFRLIGLFILVKQYESAPNLGAKQALADFYLSQTARINNWDLVDLSAPKILGDWLWTKEHLEKHGLPAKLKTAARLNKLVVSPNLWQRRIAVLATFAFIKNGSAAEAFQIAEKLLNDKEDLIHKAVGWMLREAGKRVSGKKLLIFLDKNYRRMPRTALRYALERLTPAQRAHYLAR